jgi:hypothetical protein
MLFHLMRKHCLESGNVQPGIVTGIGSLHEGHEIFGRKRTGVLSPIGVRKG